jgi:hypothetical protein
MVTTGPSGRQTIVVEQGSPWSGTVAAVLGGVTPNLATYTSRMVIRYGSGSTLVLTDGSGLSLATNVITIAITSAQTAAITGDGVYYIEITDAGGEIDRVLHGEFKLGLNAGV